MCHLSKFIRQIFEYLVFYPRPDLYLNLPGPGYWTNLPCGPSNFVLNKNQVIIILKL